MIFNNLISFACPAAQQQSKKPQSDKKLVDLPLLEMNMAREEGEGMETTETESVSTAGTPPPSLEQLLTSPDPKHGNVPVLFLFGWGCCIIFIIFTKYICFYSAGVNCFNHSYLNKLLELG